MGGAEGRLGDPDFVSPYDEHHKLKRELKRMRTFCEQRLAMAEQEKQMALERQYIELAGSIEEKLKIAQESSKEERVELLHRQIVRRMISSQETYAWNAWVDFWEARRYAMRHIKLTRERLHAASGLAPAFEFWAHACDEQRRVDQLNDLKDRLRNLEARLATAQEEKRVELERQLISLTGPAEERMKLQAVEFKEAQVEQMRKQIVRRMMSQQLASGWVAWFELWDARSSALRKLRQASAMLHSPDKINAFTHWYTLATKMKHAQDVARAEREAKSLDHQLRQARFEQGQLTMLKTAHLDEIRTLKEKVGALVEELRERDVLLAAADRYKEENEALKDQSAFSAEAQQAAEAQRSDMEKTVERQLRANQDLLERLLEQQRAKFEEDLAAFKKEAWDRAETEEKNKRLDVMRERIARRMLNQSIARGWSSWYDSCQARLYVIECREKAVGHVGRSAKISAFGAWWHHWDAIRRAKLARAESELRRIQIMQEDYARIKGELAEAERERLELREKVARLDGSYADMEKLGAERARVHQEERIELLHRQSIRRIARLALFQGWKAWHDMYKARSHALRHLKRTCTHLQTPQLSWAFKQLQKEWWESVKESEMSTWQRKEAELEATVSRLEEELQTAKDVIEAKQAAFEVEKAAALAKQATELTGTLEERLALKDEEAKSARVDALTRQMARRMMYGAIGGAFAAWVEAWEARCAAFAQLRRARNMLKSPEVLLAFRFWADDAVEERRMKEIAQIEKEARSVEAQLRRARFENDQMLMVQTKDADEIAYLKEKVSDLTDQYQEQKVAFDATLGLRGEIQGLRGQLSEALEKAEESERRRVEAEDDIGRQRRENQKLLEKLLADQRAGFVEEVRSMKRLREQATASKKVSEEELSEALDATNKAKAALREKERELTKARDEVEGWVKVVDEKEQSAARLQQENVRLQEMVTASRADVEKAEETLSAMRNHYLKNPPAPPEVEASAETPAGEDKKSPPPEKIKKKPNKGSVLGNIDLDEGPDALPVKDQLAMALQKSSARVLDLFREWDKNGDGEVDLSEFRRAIPALGLDVPQETVDELFREWDKDGGGAITFKELSSILKHAGRAAAAMAKAKGATNVMAALKKSAPSPTPTDNASS